MHGRRSAAKEWAEEPMRVLIVTVVCAGLLATLAITTAVLSFV